MLTFPSAPPPSRATPAVKPRRAPKVNRLLRKLELQPLTFFFKSQKSSAHASDAWRHSHHAGTFLSGVSIVTSLDDTSVPLAREQLRSCLHQTNPCAKRKVLSLTKPKGKIYKTKSLGHYITQSQYNISLSKSVYIWPKRSIMKLLHFDDFL